MFANDITLDRPTAPSDVKISGSDTHAVWLSDGKFALKYDGSAEFDSTLSTGGLDVSAAGGAGSTLSGDGRLTLQFPSGGGSGVGMFSIYSGTTKTFELFSGGALQFSGQTNSSTGNSVSVTATSFDHYEQGTFTPYFGFGLTSPSYTYAGGDYIRIGNIVHFYITISATGTNNGDAIQILGLPYPTAGTDGGSASFAYNTGLVVNGATMPNIYITNTGRILFYDTGSGNSWAGNSGNGVSGAQLYIGGHYICA